MATSVIATFAACAKDLAFAATAALVCFEIAAECAAANSQWPLELKMKMTDRLFCLDKKTIDKMQKAET
jgi:hydroxyethylthiazole kinase-like sugar kinase family protein